MKCNIDNDDKCTCNFVSIMMITSSFTLNFGKYQLLFRYSYLFVLPALVRLHVRLVYLFKSDVIAFLWKALDNIDLNQSASLRE